MGIENNPRETIENYITSLGIELEFDKLGININKEIEQIANEVNLERLLNNPVKINKEDIKKLLV